MNKTKIVIGLVAIVALTLAIVGLAAAQIAQNPLANTSTNPNTAISNSGLWGWIGSCFGFRASQPYTNQYVTPPVATSSPGPAPYQGGYYGNGYGYGYGSCMGR